MDIQLTVGLADIVVSVVILESAEMMVFLDILAKADIPGLVDIQDILGLADFPVTVEYQVIPEAVHQAIPARVEIQGIVEYPVIQEKALPVILVTQEFQDIVEFQVIRGSQEKTV